MASTAHSSDTVAAGGEAGRITYTPAANPPERAVVNEATSSEVGSAISSLSPAQVKKDAASHLSEQRASGGDGTSEEDESKFSKALHVRRDWYCTISTFVAGGVAGAASRTLTAPLDRIKILVQEGHLIQNHNAAKTAPRGAPSAAATTSSSMRGAQAAVKAATSTASAAASAVKAATGAPQRMSLLQVAKFIKADGGWQSFWRGNVINCFKAGPEFAIVFSIRRYLTSLYEDCVEREKARRRLSKARWRERDERNSAIERREYEEREAMLLNSSVPSPPDATSFSSASLAASSAIATSGYHFELTSAEQHERDRVISREVSIFTPPFNRLGCLSSIPQLVINCGIGAVAGLGAQGILYPLELVKTRFIVSKSNEYTGGVKEIVRLAYKKGGIAEFYRGFTPNMVGIVVYRGLEMGLYSSAQQSIMVYRMQVKKMSRHDANLSSAEVGLVGMYASIVAQTVSYPLNVIRTRLQTQGTNGRAKVYNGMVDCCIKMIRKKGVTSLFSGLTANYLKAVPASASTFVVFEWTQRMLLGDD